MRLHLLEFRPAAPPARTGWRVVMLTVLAALLVCVPLSGQSGTIVLTVELPDRPTAGARLFVQKSCARCHSVGGTEPRVGPDLGRILFSGTVLDLAGAFWNHSPVMREKMQDLKIRPPNMNSSEMADIVAFLTAWRYYLTEVGARGNATHGRKVFVAKRCASCHEENAWTTPGPSLQRYRGRFSAIFLAQAMWNHGPEMETVMRSRGVPWPKFDGREMGDLIAYLQSGNGGNPDDPVYFEPGSPRRGRELFSSKSCIACHSVGGKGGKGGPDLGTRAGQFVRSVPEIAGLMWNHSQGMTAESQRRGIPRVSFSGQEMADIIAYLYYINYAVVRGLPARGAELYTQKCSACHSDTRGRRLAPDLTQVAGLDNPFAILSAMWNHAPKMESELRAQGLAWPRFEVGEAADLTAFLLWKRSGLPRTALR